jgi:hypothetical protein
VSRRAQRMAPDAHVLATHRLAMEAKRTIFRAQDAEGRIDPGAGLGHPIADLGVKLRRRLAKVRAELEALDRDVRNAMEIDAPLGSSPRTSDETWAACEALVDCDRKDGG